MKHIAFSFGALGLGGRLAYALAAIAIIWFAIYLGLS